MSEGAEPVGSVRGTGGAARRAEVLRRMDREWEALQTDAVAAAACVRWAGLRGALAGCARPDEVLERVARAPDEVLLALLEEAAGGDRVAARVVLQALLPKAVLMASVDPAAEVDDYVTALWCEIAAYPVRRRHTSVAANLALDTLKAVRRERRPVLDVAMPPHLVVLAAERRAGHGPAAAARSSPGSAETSAEEVLRLAREHRLVDPRTSDLLRSVYAEGLSGEAAGRRHGLSAVAVRSRCSRAVRHLARHPELLTGTP